MSKNNGKSSPAPSKGGSMIAGILVGMVLGLIIAGGVAWYITKQPSPFVNKGHRHDVAEPELQQPPEGEPQVAPETAATAASAADDGKPRFEFYKVLTDKQDGSLPAQQATPSTPQAKAPAQPSSSPGYYLQAGSFSNESDADKVKARLALLGLEARVQSVNIPDKGIWHRVRLGPYSNTDEMNKVRTTLKQNGVDSTPMRVR